MECACGQLKKHWTTGPGARAEAEFAPSTAFHYAKVPDPVSSAKMQPREHQIEPAHFEPGVHQTIFAEGVRFPDVPAEMAKAPTRILDQRSAFATVSPDYSAAC